MNIFRMIKCILEAYCADMHRFLYLQTRTKWIRSERTQENPKKKPIDLHSENHTDLPSENPKTKQKGHSEINWPLVGLWNLSFCHEIPCMSFIEQPMGLKDVSILFDLNWIWIWYELFLLKTILIWFVIPFCFSRVPLNSNSEKTTQGSC